MNIIIAIFIGGGLGSVTRFSISKLITSNFQNINPVATLTSNVISTIILGVIMFLSIDKIDLSSNIKALIVVGFCGGFSTFSTFSYEIFELIRTGSIWMAAINIFISISVAVGVLFFLSKNL